MADFLGKIRTTIAGLFREKEFVEPDAPEQQPDTPTQDVSPGAIGEVRFLNLEELRTELGLKWDRLGPMISLFVENIIGRHTTTFDSFSSDGDTRYVIVFAHLSPEEAVARCETIVADIRKHLLNALGITPMIEISADAQKLQAEMANLQLADLDALFPDPVNLLPPGHKIDGKRPVSASGTAAYNPDNETALRLRAMPADGGTIAVPSASTVLESQLANIEWVCQVQWAIKSKQPYANFYLPMRRLPSGGYQFEDAALDDPGDEQLLQACDAAALQTLCAAMKNHRPGGPLYGISLHHRALATGYTARDELIECCRRLGPAAHQGLVLEIAGVPPDAATTRLTDILIRLRPFCSALWVEGSLGWRDFKMLAAAGVSAVGFIQQDTHLNEDVWLEQLSDFVLGARTAGLASYARNLGSRDLVMAAIGFGVDYLGGGYLSATEPGQETSPAFRYEDIARSGLS